MSRILGNRRINLWESAQINELTYAQNYIRLKNLCLNSIEWKNIPDSVNERFLELCLFNEGVSVFFKDDVMGYLATQVRLGPDLNIYREPIGREAYGINGFHERLTPENSVLIWNDYTRANSANMMLMYAKRIYELERAIDVNVMGQKTPIMVLCDESQRLTLKNLFMKYEGNVPFIYGDKMLDLGGIKTLDLKNPFIAPELHALKTQYWNEALTYIGIENTTFEKRERLVETEVQSGQGGIAAQRYARLDSRRVAVDAINKMFGLNIEVDFRIQTSTMEEETHGTMLAELLNKAEGGENE